MTKNLVKVDIELTKVSDMFQALLDGYILLSKSSSRCVVRLEILDGYLYINNTKSSVSNGLYFTDDIAPNYQVYKQVKWYDSIPPKGVLCWVWDTDETLKYPEIVIKYENGCIYKFYSSGGNEFINATPFTKEDALGYLLPGIDTYE